MWIHLFWDHTIHIFYSCWNKDCFFMISLCCISCIMVKTSSKFCKSSLNANTNATYVNNSVIQVTKAGLYVMPLRIRSIKVAFQRPKDVTFNWNSSLGVVILLFFVFLVDPYLLITTLHVQSIRDIQKTRIQGSWWSVKIGFLKLAALPCVGMWRDEKAFAIPQLLLLKLFLIVFKNKVKSFWTPLFQVIKFGFHTHTFRNQITVVAVATQPFTINKNSELCSSPETSWQKFSGT